MTHRSDDPNLAECLRDADPKHWLVRLLDTERDPETTSPTFADVVLRPLELLTHWAAQAAERVKAGHRWSNEAHLVFTGPLGAPLDVDAFGKSVPRLMKKAGKRPDQVERAPPGTRTQNLRIKSPLLCQIELEAREQRS